MEAAGIESAASVEERLHNSTIFPTKPQQRERGSHSIEGYKKASLPSLYDPNPARLITLPPRVLTVSLHFSYRRWSSRWQIVVLTTARKAREATVLECCRTL